MAQDNGIELIGRPQWHARWRAGWRRLIAWSDALPALLAAALVAGLGVVASSKRLDETQAAYAREGDRAFQAGDYATARVCYGRLANVPDPRPEALWGLALTYEAAGDMGRAASLYDRLAPLESAGYAPAQVRRARALLKTPAASPLATRAVAAAEQHLRRALESDPTSVEICTMLGHLLMATGQPGQAAPVLARAVHKKPELRLTLARAYAAANQPEFAREEADRARLEATQGLAATPDDFSLRVRLARATVFLGDSETALKVLRQGLERTGDPRYRPLLAEIYVAWSDAAARPPAADSARSLLLLEEGLRIDPGNGPLLERFGRLLKAGGPQSDRVRQTLRSLLTQGQGTAGTHFALGLDAWFRGDTDAARIHLEQAARLAPTGPAIANNLAWVLAHGPDPDLSRALSLVELALDRQPGEPQYRGTRGSILVRLGRWKDALPDLETALTKDPNDRDLHRDLAVVYERLGLPDMAAGHREHAAGPQGR